MNNVFSYDGESGFSGSLRNIHFPKKFNKDLLNIPRDTTHWVRYIDMTNHAPQYGEMLIDVQKPGIVCTLCGWVPEWDTTGRDNGAGIIMVYNLTGAFDPSMMTELVGQTSQTHIIIEQEFIPVLTTANPKAALISIDDANDTPDPTVGIIFTLSGSTPDPATRSGIKLYTNQMYMIRGWRNVSNFQCTDLSTPADNRAIVNYELFF